MIFKTPIKITSNVATNRFAPQKMQNNPTNAKCQISKISTSSVFVLLSTSMIIFTTTITNKKYSVYGEPHVIVAKGAHPTSVTDRLMPVDLTNALRASWNCVVKTPITEPMAVKAIASLMPPSSALLNLTLKQSAMSVNTIIIIGAAPKLMIGLKTMLAK